MLTIKQYANGRYYHTADKKYLKKEDLVELIQKNTKMKIVFSKTGKDITKKAVSQLTQSTKTKKKASGKKAPIKKWITENKKWITENIDDRINKILGAMNLPTKKQVTQLTAGINALNKKVSELEKRQAEKVKQMEKIQAQQVKKMQQEHTEQIQEMEQKQADRMEQLEKKQEAVDTDTNATQPAES